MRSCSMSVCARAPVPAISVVLCQSADVSVVEATYFGSALSLLATGSPGSVTRGQCVAKIS